jgi:hypothetical protein
MVLWIVIIFCAVVLLAVIVGAPSPDAPRQRDRNRRPVNRGGN